MKVDLNNNELRNGQTLRLIPENFTDRQSLADFLGDFGSDPYLKIICEGIGTSSFKVVPE